MIRVMPTYTPSRMVAEPQGVRAALAPVSERGIDEGSTRDH
jgi:hypothetical protein